MAIGFGFHFYGFFGLNGSAEKGVARRSGKTITARAARRHRPTARRPMIGTSASRTGKNWIPGLLPSGSGALFFKFIIHHSTCTIILAGRNPPSLQEFWRIGKKPEQSDLDMLPHPMSTITSILISSGDFSFGWTRVNGTVSLKRRFSKNLSLARTIPAFVPDAD